MLEAVGWNEGLHSLRGYISNIFLFVNIPNFDKNRMLDGIPSQTNPTPNFSVGLK